MLDTLLQAGSGRNLDFPDFGALQEVVPGREILADRLLDVQECLRLSVTLGPASGLEHGIVPERFQVDAGHIALATVGQVDIVVSWNFRHIVRFDRIRMFNAANRELGYKEVEIYSPREVTRYEEG